MHSEMFMLPGSRNSRDPGHPPRVCYEVLLASLLSAKILFEKRDCFLVDFVNRRSDGVGAYLFEVMSSVLDWYEFNLESGALISLRHLN